jgi:S-DNA-T family DNA segregation ATPase FtsK/SpoIIIE
MPPLFRGPWERITARKEVTYENEQTNAEPKGIANVTRFEIPEPAKPKVKAKQAPVITFAESTPEVIIPEQLLAQAVVSKKVQTDLFKDVEPGALPDSELLDLRSVSVRSYSNDELEDMSRLVEQSLQDFNVPEGAASWLSLRLPENPQCLCLKTD